MHLTPNCSRKKGIFAFSVKIYFYDITYPGSYGEPFEINIHLIENGISIGYCDFHLSSYYYNINGIYIVKSKRRKGYASDILNHIEKLYPRLELDPYTHTTIQGDRFFHKVKGTKIDAEENKYKIKKLT